MSENIFKRKTKIIDDDEEKEVSEKPLTTEEKLNQMEKNEKLNTSAFKNHSSTIEKQKIPTSESTKATGEPKLVAKTISSAEGKDLQKIRDLILAKKSTSSSAIYDKSKTSTSIGNKLNTPSIDKIVSKDTSNNSNAKPLKNESNKVHKPVQSGNSNLNNMKKPVDSSNLKNGSIKNLLEKANSTYNSVSKQINNINISRNFDKSNKDQKILNKKRKRSLTPDSDDESESEDSDYSSRSEGSSSGSNSGSESDSSESSSESSSSEVSSRKRNNNFTSSGQKEKKPAVRENTKKISSSATKSNNRLEKKTTTNNSNGKILKPKDCLIYQLLKRWWYAIEEWPPRDYNPQLIIYRDKLKDLRLYFVDKSDWKLYPNINEEGFAKSCEFDGFKFVFIDYTGKIHDLRPQENRPSYNNFNKYSEKQLYLLLVKALKNQITELNENEKYSVEDDDVVKSLEKELKVAENNLNRLSR